ncbi:heterokaryon incompatibility protein-domain-containing protein [Lasiosphaeris hirsuta]|uniref:Heterokaryon incompatibility protein-domain-containing protein n=1 Tax=Lasiosphaeris hirsuta TaxID=260670 RepID=A0AA40DLT9_9PEZI|nr:heterokaryon incompatibility protein-domain-containing protein [Lasiosphaeris hirsuta]
MGQSPGPTSVTPLPNTSFQYKPLPSRSTIRILHLQRRLRDYDKSFESLPLRGSLIERAIDSGFEYCALSYTWGDPAPCETIEIDGRTMGITASCASALRRMLRGKTERYIWVDSICINQANTPDALDERGSQVAMMDQIYRGAEKVLVHLGPGDAASDVACDALKSLMRYYLGAKHGIGGPMEEYRQKYEELADDVLAITPEYPYGKLYGVFRLPWFRRTWVVQEVALGRNVMFYCGEKMMHLKTVLVGADFTRLPYSKIASDPVSGHWRTYVEYHDSMNEFIRRREEGEPLSEMVGGLTLSHVLMLPALTLEATRPEDKVHGMYGICKRLGLELPEPDYKKPLATVYTEAAQAVLRYDSDLGILAHVCESSGWELGIPSWVPNFSGSARHWTPSNPPHMPISSRTKSNVSASSVREYEYALGGQGLQVKGRRSSLVSAVGLPWMADASKTMLGGASQAENIQLIDSLLPCLPGWLEVVQSRSDHPDEQTAMRMLAHALIQDVDRPISDQELTSFSHNLAVMMHWATTGVRLATSPQDDSLSPSDMAALLLGVQSMAAILGRLIGLQWKVVFRTSDGHIGVGTHTVQDDDIMAVLHGFRMVAILRPWGEWYRYVGPAYVDGIMEGEFWNATSEADDEWFTLV